MDWEREHLITVGRHSININDARVNEIKKARDIMKHHFDDDPGFKQAYVSNIAMLLSDRYGITDYNDRNDAAEDIIDLIFYDRR